ncbi:MAG TPA: type IV secretory system conjugative DNA transfer family protein [Acidimicrobiales bacterium]|nr:type IV secretory system conjugative DNA transfer family protein [Acidimicrobiales bacterium]
METFFAATPQHRVTTGHRAALGASARAGHGVYLGHDARGWCFAPSQHSVMVLGPPRSGKSSSVIIPNVLAGNGPVVSTSTKPDVLDATAAARSRLGRCHLFDPTGSASRSGLLTPLRWSPLQSCRTWPGALSTARSLVEVGTLASGGHVRAEGSHWTERAQAVLAPLLHAAALDGTDMRTVLTWVDRHQALPAQQILAGEPGRTTELARNLLDGIAATDERELSGIWSTASGALTGFRSEQALEATSGPDFDPDRFVDSSDTIYISAPAHRQALVAPMVVGLVEDIRQAAYARHAERSHAQDPVLSPPVLLALDEVANIAPIPDLPAMVSEGGGQGVAVLACLQDLSQARHRWPGRADGFPSLFGTTVVLPGIGDVSTLEALATLAGDEELLTRTTSSGRTLTDRPVSDLLSGGRPQFGESVSTQWRRRLPADVIARGTDGHALAFDHRNRPTWIPLAPSYAVEPWRALRQLELPSHQWRHPTLERGR